MKALSAFAFACLCLAGCVAPRGSDTPVASPSEAGFTPIFNGRNLDGWIGAKHLYYVENGELVFKEGPKNFGNLFYHKPFANFTARFSFKLVPNGNNGFAVRAGKECVEGGALIGGNKVMTDAAYNGMEIQVLDDTGDKKQHLKAWQYHGCIYGVVTAQKGALRPVGEWNEMEFLCKGGNIKVTLNGVMINEAQCKATEGYIGLQSEGGAMEFRNIFLSF